MLYFYDGEDIVQAFDGATVVGRYVHGPGVDDLLQGENSGGSAFPLTDGLGSLTEFESNGAVFMRFQYTPFGAQTSTYNPYSLQSPYGYTGREHDDETGLMYYRSRYYSPEQRRFVQEDKWAGRTFIPNSYNSKYSYSASNPTNFNDPYGYWMDDIYVIAQTEILYEAWWLTRSPRYRVWGPQNNWTRFVSNIPSQNPYSKTFVMPMGHIVSTMDCIETGLCDGSVDPGFACQSYAQDLADFLKKHGNFPDDLDVKIEPRQVGKPYANSHDRVYIEFNGYEYSYDPFWRVGPFFRRGIPGTEHM